MIDTVNSHSRRIHGQTMYPSMYGDKGWYGFTPAKYSHGAQQIWYWSMSRGDRERLPETGWLRFLDGKSPNYPEQALTADFLAIRAHVVGLRADRTTPSSRLADDPMAYNPATVPNLVNLMLGGLYPGHVGSPLHCRVRYFDPEKRRAGLPEDVAALVDRLSDKETGLTLVNISPVATPHGHRPRGRLRRAPLPHRHSEWQADAHRQLDLHRRARPQQRRSPCPEHQALRQLADDEFPLEDRHGGLELKRNTAGLKARPIYLTGEIGQLIKPAPFPFAAPVSTQ